MRTATAREFKMHPSRYLSSRENTLVTKRGRPLAVVTPVPEDSVESLLLGIRKIFQEAGISKRQALQALEEARREVYGPRRR